MDQRLKNALGYLAAALAVVLIAHYGVDTRNAIRNPSNYSISMTATGKVSAKPDTAQIAFSVVTTGKDPAQTQQENDKKMAKVIDFLKSKGVAEGDVQTSNYNLSPQYNYSSGDQPAPISGYTLTQSVTAKIRNLDSVNGIMGALTAQGVNQIDNVTHFIDDPDALKAQAREMAVDNAKQKAQDLAKKLGIKLGKVTSFSENNYYQPSPYAYGYGGGAGGGMGSAIQPGTQDVEVEITLSFELK